MTIKLTGLALVVLMLSACTHGTMHAVKRDDIVNRYGSAIRWGLFDQAASFQNPSHRVPLDESWLKNIHVASYNPVYRGDEKDRFTLEQKVEIRYYNELVGVEKILIDHQLWRYYEDEDKWMLETDLPTIR